MGKWIEESYLTECKKETKIYRIYEYDRHPLLGIFEDLEVVTKLVKALNTKKVGKKDKNGKQKTICTHRYSFRGVKEN